MRTCYDKYRSLKKQKLILDLKEIYKTSENKDAKSYEFNPKFIKALTKNQENQILNQIIYLLNEGKPVSTIDLSRLAYSQYYSIENFYSRAYYCFLDETEKKIF